MFFFSVYIVTLSPEKCKWVRDFLGRGFFAESVGTIWQIFGDILILRSTRVIMGMVRRMKILTIDRNNHGVGYFHTVNHKISEV